MRVSVGALVFPTVCLSLAAGLQPAAGLISPLPMSSTTAMKPVATPRCAVTTMQYGGGYGQQQGQFGR